jgi:tRNA pseudouridine55 synthase
VTSNQQPVTNIFEQGQLLLINKPLRWTSFDTVNKIRNLVRVKKVGHAGTLDPLATGLLIICTGKFTKKINEYQAQEKEYTGTFTLGATTPTYDLESEPENLKPFEQLKEEDIRSNVEKFTGEILQVPPAHSAIKLDGKRVYELARQGKEVKLEPRKIIIKEFEIVKIDPIAIGLPLVHFRVVCSTGTYIRSLANDFGAALGCGAYLSSLCRTRIGNFLLQDAMTPDEFEKKIKQDYKIKG